MVLGCVSEVNQFLMKLSTRASTISGHLVSWASLLSSGIGSAAPTVALAAALFRPPKVLMMCGQ